jgi:hypothetical protein
MKLLQC